MKKLQKKSLKLAEVGSCDLRKEAIPYGEYESARWSGKCQLEAAASYPEGLAKMTKESGYTTRWVFIGDETTWYSKETPSVNLIAREEKSMPGFKVSQDRTFLLGINSSGDLNLKPVLIYH